MTILNGDERYEAYRKVIADLGGAPLALAAESDGTDGDSPANFGWLDVDALNVELYEYGEIWSRPGLDLRTRALISIAVCSAQCHHDELERQIHQALNIDISPVEITETLLHVSVYAGIPTWRRAIVVARRVFESRGVIGPGPKSADPQLPMTRDQRQSAAQRVLSVLRLRRLGPRDEDGRLAPLSGGHLAVLATHHLPAESDLYTINLEQGYGEVWGRDGLDLRARSFITCALLQVLQQDDQLHIHVNNALNNGLSADELHEAFAQAGLYGGTSSWHNATHVARDVFIKRGLQSPLQEVPS